MSTLHHIQNPPAPHAQKTYWGALYGAADAFVISRLTGVVVVVAGSAMEAVRLRHTLEFFSDSPILKFPSNETLPYDHISPHQDITSRRLETLHRTPQMTSGFLVTTVETILHRICPKTYIETNALIFKVGQKIGFSSLIKKLEKSGFSRVSQVLEHGEFSIRGEIIDLFPMGEKLPIRLDFFDDEIESIKIFDPKTQASTETCTQIKILPASEIPMDKPSINLFTANWHKKHPNALNEVVYQSVQNGLRPAGIEYYLPWFFEQTASYFDYLPDNTTIITSSQIQSEIKIFQNTFQNRFNEQDGYVLTPKSLILQSDEFFGALKRFKHISVQNFAQEHSHAVNFNTTNLPPVAINHKLPEPMTLLLNFLSGYTGRVLFVAESAGRLEILKEMLVARNINPITCNCFSNFYQSNISIGIAVGDLQINLHTDDFCIISEDSLLGSHIKQRRNTKKTSNEQVFNNLVELKIDQAVVHVDHGVGRYRGLKTLVLGGQIGEFLVIEYDKSDLLYVPVDALNLIHRYSGANINHAPMHRLGSRQWEKVKNKAKQKAQDIAAELLEIFAKRQQAKAKGINALDESYQLFATSFPFDPTTDQQQAIDATIKDMQSHIPMDRLVCGDVGFGKTEVAMRAVFLAAQNNRQTAVLVPTTLLAEQHHQSFVNRFADWALEVEILSRFKSPKEVKACLAKIKTGMVDVVIGTHKLLSNEVQFKNLGLLVIDEEHRFGVKQKEKFKALRSQIDILTLTATPIPRTLNLSISGLRDLSIIATAPNNRIAIETFVQQWDMGKICEACYREISRGGQVYFLHNRVQDIEKVTRELRTHLPEANIGVAHGQMNETKLEQIMLDFYHQKINILVCTTIIETGLDVPNANTIIINRADKLGLAQLYQIRGRVGRSHHQAYAYLITPEDAILSENAKKRLQAIESIKDLGAGFSLALEDMEIRGTGEILGDEQSGQIQDIGLSMYSEILEQAVNDLKFVESDTPSFKPQKSTIEIKLGKPALLPEDYVADINVRLVIYKNLSQAKDRDAINEIEVGLIDRFGALPEFGKNLVEITKLKLMLAPIGIKKISGDNKQINIEFIEQPHINPTALIALVQKQPKTYKLLGPDKLTIFEDFETIDQITAIKSCIEHIHAE